MSTAHERPAKPVIGEAIVFLEWSERVVFFGIGLLMFVAAVVLLAKSTTILLAMATGDPGTAIGFGSRFLDIALLVLMVVELAYTVTLSLQGQVLVAEPFLIVGLIAVIRRILVITVGEVGPKGQSVEQHVVELAILTGVVVVFVGSIVMLRLGPKRTPATDASGVVEATDLPPGIQ